MIEYGRRTRKLPAPPRVVHDDLVALNDSGARAWLMLLDDEVKPRVIESSATRVVWSSLWPDRPDDRIVIELAPVHAETALTFTLLASGEAPDDGKTGHIRKRVNQLLFGELRFSYGN